MDPDNFSHDLADITEAARLGRWTTHELRHSAGSLLYAMGVPMKVISETLGHSSERVTSEAYVHLQAEHRGEAAEPWGVPCGATRACSGGWSRQASAHSATRCVTMRVE